MEIKMTIIIEVNTTPMHECRGLIYSVVAFKIDNIFFYCQLPKLPNNSAFEKLESFRFKIMLKFMATDYDFHN